jgi:hypothetical protein
MNERMNEDLHSPNLEYAVFFFLEKAVLETNLLITEKIMHELHSRVFCQKEKPIPYH